MIEANGLVKRYGSTTAVNAPTQGSVAVDGRRYRDLPAPMREVGALLDAKALAVEGRTVLVSSHLMSEMALTADHLLVIGKGRLIADTSVDEFVRSSSQQSVHVRSPQAAELAARCREAGAGVQAGTDPGVIEITGTDSAEVGKAGRRPWQHPVRAHPRPSLAGGGVHGTDQRQRGVPVDRGDPMTDAATALAGPDHRAAFRPATFGDALRSEWTKLRSVRSTFWALTVTVVLGVGLGAAISAAAAHGYAKSSVSQKLSWDPTALSLDGIGIATLAIAVLGVLCISSEYSSGMIRTSLIAGPKRGLILAYDLVSRVAAGQLDDVDALAAVLRNAIKPRQGCRPRPGMARRSIATRPPRPRCGAGTQAPAARPAPGGALPRGHGDRRPPTARVPHP